jgi:membrane protein
MGMAMRSAARLAAGARRWLGGVWRLLHLTGYKFAQDRGSLLAAAMAFYAFLAVFPFALLLIAGLGHFLGSSEAAFSRVSDYLGQAMPELRMHIHGQLKQIILHRKVVGWLGLLALIYSASGGFGTVQTALVQIWEIPSPHRFLVARLKSLGLVLAAMVLLILSVTVTSVAAITARLPLSRLTHVMRHLAPLWGPKVGVASLIFGFAMFMALYSIVSSPRVPRRYLALGAAFAAVAWELAKFAFAWYVESYAAFDRIYGPMGAVVILLLWIYVSCLILVVGAELAWVRARLAEERLGGTRRAGSAFEKIFQPEPRPEGRA